MKRSAKTQALHDLIAPAVAACGVALWGIEFLPQGRRSLLRVYIDQPHQDDPETISDEGGRGIGVEDCVRVTHQVSGVLDVHDPIAGEYALEVSSPGWDRPFFELSQMHDYVGQRVALRLISPVANRRKVDAVIESVDEEGLVVLMDGQPQRIDGDNIDKAHLVYQD